MKAETKRNWQALFVWIALMAGTYAVYGFADWTEVFIRAWIYLIVGGILVLIWDKLGLFRKAPEISEEDHRRYEGHSALVEGNKRYPKNQFCEALTYFDRAVECGLRDKACERRAFCLQALEFHIDAIEDFDHAIRLRSDDPNLYYVRSLSRSAICEHDEAMVDLRKAISLSKVDNELNRVLSAAAKEMGSPDGHTSMYVVQQYGEQIMKDLPQEHKDQRKARGSKRRNT